MVDQLDPSSVSFSWVYTGQSSAFANCNISGQDCVSPQRHGKKHDSVHSVYCALCALLLDAGRTYWPKANHRSHHVIRWTVTYDDIFMSTHANRSMLLFALSTHRDSITPQNIFYYTWYWSVLSIYFLLFKYLCSLYSALHNSIPHASICKSFIQMH